MNDADSFDRSHRQILLPGIGEEGQRRLRASHALASTRLLQHGSFTHNEFLVRGEFA